VKVKLSDILIYNQQNTRGEEVENDIGNRYKWSHKLVGSNVQACQLASSANREQRKEILSMRKKYDLK
jgi:hypothetical protein